MSAAKCFYGNDNERESTLMHGYHNKYKECYCDTKLERTEITALSD